MATTRITFKAILYFVAIGCALAAPRPNFERLLVGEDAAAGDYPWVVSVRVDNAHACVGSIISPDSIVTAGHCISQMGSVAIATSRVTVRVGSINQYAGGQIVNAAALHIHPSYGNFLYDIAVINLSTSLEFSDRVQPIPLAEGEEDLEEGAEVKITGWGLLLSGATPFKLQEATMTILSSPNCEYEAGYGYESVLCLSHPVNEGACRGDDGAGVVHNGELVGVYSFAFANCGSKYPDIAGKASYFADWIHSVVN